MYIDDMFVVCVAMCVICTGQRRIQNPRWHCRQHQCYRRRHCRRLPRQEPCSRHSQENLRTGKWYSVVTFTVSRSRLSLILS